MSTLFTGLRNVGSLSNESWKNVDINCYACVQLSSPWWELTATNAASRCSESSAKITRPKNTHLLCKGKYHCMADLLFDLLVLSCFAYVELDRDLQVWSNPNQSNWRSTVQWYFALRSKWVFSDSAIQAAILILWLYFSSWWRMFKQGTVCRGPGSEFNHQQI